MNIKELKALIISLTTDIEFEYQGKEGSICPFNLHDIAITYDGQTLQCNSVDEVLKATMFNGKSLEQISQELIV